MKIAISTVVVYLLLFLLREQLLMAIGNLLIMADESYPAAVIDVIAAHNQPIGKYGERESDGARAF